MRHSAGRCAAWRELREGSAGGPVARHDPSLPQQTRRCRATAAEARAGRWLGSPTASSAGCDRGRGGAPPRPSGYLRSPPEARSAPSAGRSLPARPTVGRVVDDLGTPIDFAANHGGGLDRTVVLGGGGIFFIAWQTAYLAVMRDNGIDLGLADRVVGTSAGSVVGSYLAAGRLPLMSLAASVLSRARGVVAAMAPAADLAPSQLRALDVLLSAQDAAPETVQRVGHAALAAAAPSAAQMRRSIGLLVGRRWPSRKLFVTAADANTGERLVVTATARISAARAVAASTAVPGVFAPQRLGDRFAMDGGVCGTTTHCDLVAGAGRALVLGLEPIEPRPQASSTAGVDGVVREMESLSSSGTEVFFRCPVVADPQMLMSPDAIEPGLAAGREQARQDLPAFTQFWA